MDELVTPESDAAKGNEAMGIRSAVADDAKAVNGAGENLPAAFGGAGLCGDAPCGLDYYELELVYSG
uniref:Uncharacterized protein n=1 Tax=Peronospora matthiolae TaxID=2874970 RepID=A0AAV1V3X1_9STRA